MNESSLFLFATAKRFEPFMHGAFVMSLSTHCRNP
jgi:hypothetical protein